MTKLVLALLGLLGLAALARKIKADRDEQALWHEATTAPDLR